MPVVALEAVYEQVVVAEAAEEAAEEEAAEEAAEEGTEAVVGDAKQVDV